MVKRSDRLKTSLSHFSPGNDFGNANFAAPPCHHDFVDYLVCWMISKHYPCQKVPDQCFSCKLKSGYRWYLKIGILITYFFPNGCTLLGIYMELGEYLQGLITL